MKKQDDEQLPGQLSVFDLLNEGRPCEYTWQREIGQMVELEDGTIRYRNNDGSIVATIPVKYIKISAPRQMSDEQKEICAERLRAMREK